MINTQYDTFSSATDMLRDLRARKISAVELLEVHMRRIKQYNPVLNAIVNLNYDSALAAAKDADAARARGEDKLLLGLPMTIKDTIDVLGFPTTFGTPLLANSMPKADASIVGCVRAAGAVFMGKSNIPPYGIDWQVDNELFGRTGNPWDQSRSPGGSTGGGATALATGMTAMDFGGDIAGSIRIPAAFCGIYAHKPTELGIPFSGNVPGPYPNTAAPFSIQGPLARYASDLELALDVLAGPNPQDPTTWHLTVPPPRHTNLTDYRVAVLPPIKWLPVDNEILETQDQLVSKLRSMGMKVEETQPEGFGDMRDYYDLYSKILAAITSSQLPLKTRAIQSLVYRIVGDQFYTSRSRGLLTNAGDYMNWYIERERYRASFRAFFRDWDILLTPANIVPPFPHTNVRFSKRRLDVNNQKALYLLQNAYPGVATLCGQPATIFPAGFTRSNLPIGLQVIGPFLEDRTPIRFTALLAQEFGGFQRPPGYD